MRNTVISFSALKELAKLLSDFPPYDVNWVESHLVCASPTQECYFGGCANCGAERLRAIPLPENADVMEVSVILWIKSHNEMLQCDQFVKAKVTKTLDALFTVSVRMSVLLLNVLNNFWLNIIYRNHFYQR
jgi:hypothetical protein